MGADQYLGKKSAGHSQSKDSRRISRAWLGLISISAPSARVPLVFSLKKKVRISGFNSVNFPIRIYTLVILFTFNSSARLRRSSKRSFIRCVSCIGFAPGQKKDDFLRSPTNALCKTLAPKNRFGLNADEKYG